MWNWLETILSGGMSDEEFKALCDKEDAWVETETQKQIEEWKIEQWKRRQNPVTEFDDDVPF